MEKVRKDGQRIKQIERNLYAHTVSETHLRDAKENCKRSESPTEAD